MYLLFSANDTYKILNHSYQINHQVNKQTLWHWFGLLRDHVAITQCKLDNVHRSHTAVSLQNRYFIILRNSYNRGKFIWLKIEIRYLLAPFCFIKQKVVEYTRKPLIMEETRSGKVRIRKAPWRHDPYETFIHYLPMLPASSWGYV